MLSLTSLLGNSQMLDGGAMFGNAPKALWSRWVNADQHNRIALNCRCMLVRDGSRNILFETGIGAFFEPKLKHRYGVQENHHVLLDSLQDVGLSDQDIDILVLSHLHFDHAGGLLSPWSENQEPALLFPNAAIITSTSAWQRACHPHFRDRGSFIPALNTLLEQSDRLELVADEYCDTLGPNYRFHYSEGHTPGLLMTEVKVNQTPVVFVGDLIPGVPWLHLPITMGYDRAAELLIDEKQSLLSELLARKGKIFFTHDANIALSGITKDDKGKFSSTDGLERLLNWTG